MNSTIVFIAAGLITGLLVPVQLAFNAQLARETPNPLIAAFFIFLIGSAAMGVVLAFMRIKLPTLEALGSVPTTAWLGGLFATAYIIAIVYVTPKLGVGMTVALILLGQLVGSTILDAIGAFGNPRVEIDSSRIIGLLLMLSGVVALKAKELISFGT